MPERKQYIRIANAQAFWGDDPSAPLRTAQQQPDLDVLTLDYLAEVSMSILAKQQATDPALGYARDFIDVIGELAPLWRDGRKLKLVTNAGGLNPNGCARAAIAALREAGVGDLRVAAVSGDDVKPQLKAAIADGSPGFDHPESHMPLGDITAQLVTSNAYIGAASIVEALRAGADIVITGRVADPSLTVGPAAHFFDWSADDFTRLAGATVAGHLIECGTQVTGGIATDWLDIVKNDDRPLGFPVVEIDSSGNCIVTKPPNTAGRVDLRTVKEQLLYELGDPARYLSPDATVNFLTLEVRDAGNDRVSVRNATGSAPPKQYKVSATYRAGYRSSVTLMLGGTETHTKAQRAAERLLASLKADNLAPERSQIEIVPSKSHGSGSGSGAGDAAVSLNTTLRIAVADPRRQIVEAFSRRVMSLITAGPQGITGYADGRPPVREVVAYWPCLIDRAAVHPTFEVFEV